MEKTYIQTPLGVKQNYRECFGKHLGDLGLPESFYYLYVFVYGCIIGDKQIRDAVLKEVEGVESFGIKKEEVLNSLKQFREENYKITQLKSKIDEIDQKYEGGKRGTTGMRTELFNLVRGFNTRLPIININLWALFVAVMNNTDLFRQEVPTEKITGMGIRQREQKAVLEMEQPNLPPSP